MFFAIFVFISDAFHVTWLAKLRHEAIHNARDIFWTIFETLLLCTIVFNEPLAIKMHHEWCDRISVGYWKWHLHGACHIVNENYKLSSTEKREKKRSATQTNENQPDSHAVLFFDSPATIWVSSQRCTVWEIEHDDPKDLSTVKTIFFMSHLLPSDNFCLLASRDANHPATMIFQWNGPWIHEHACLFALTDH